MDIQSQTNPTNAAHAATPSRGLFNGAISSRIKQMMQRKKGATTTPGATQQPKTHVEDHGKQLPATQSMTSSSTYNASTSTASSSYASTSSASTSASTSGSISGSESSPGPSKPVSVSKATMLYEWTMASGKRKDKSPKVEAGQVEYILFDVNGNPAWDSRSKGKYMGNL